MKHLLRAIRMLETLERTAMPYKRTEWIAEMRGQLKGALGNYTKLKLARDFSVPTEDWEPDVRLYMDYIKTMFDAHTTKTYSGFDRTKAFVDSVEEAGRAQYKVDEGIREFLQIQEMRSRRESAELKIRKMHLRSKDLMVEMLKEFFRPSGSEAGSDPL